MHVNESSRFAGLAANLLQQEGIAVVWKLYLAAARAHQDGNAMSARVLADIADAAERQLRAGGSLSAR